MVGGDPVQRHNADVVPIGRIFRARVAKAHEQLHRIPVPLLARLAPA